MAIFVRQITLEIKLSKSNTLEMLYFYASRSWYDPPPIPSQHLPNTTAHTTEYNYKLLEYLKKKTIYCYQTGLKIR